ncbi:MAG: TIGR03621 family F420-dependent LLM class oxidoreductase [Actinobacteria bacterium]|nr:TIGR03621 family F420-dependent LLM class oxidoreductase [Actinomycetota bacterium]MBW3643631.1 TIGR03621 family F420-dependent LLM class oxidoreductase [Actinomycetota bacterium]
MPAPRPFRFGLSLAGFDHGHDWDETARRVEDLGYSTLLVPDHLGDQLAPLPAIAVAAAATTTLRVGTYVLDNDFRHPVVVAKEAATVDLLSGGRLELGIGAGWRKEEYDRAGIAFEPGAVRVERLEEAVAVLRGLWSATPFSFSGRHYQVSEMEGRPVPAQPGGPPLFLGGGGPRLLALAGRHADIVGLAPRARPDGVLEPTDVSPESTEAKLAAVRHAAGERFAEVELNLLTLAVEVTGERAHRQQRAEELAGRWGMAPEAVLASPHVVLGSVAQIVENLCADRERYGISYVTVAEPALSSFAPVVARLAGT